MFRHCRHASTLMTVVALALFAAAPAGADEGWKPYLEEKKGDKEFPENPKALKDEKWLNIAYTEFVGFKPRIGVMVSEPRQQSPQDYSNEWIRYFSVMQGKSAGLEGINNIESQVRQALNNTHRFTMMERTTALDDVIEEQDFGASGRVEQKTAAKIGKIKGADYSVKVELVDINPEKESKSIKAVGGGIGVSTLGIGSLGMSGTVAWARLNVRIIRTETSEVVADMTVDGTAKSKGFGLGAGIIKSATHGIVGGGGSFDSKKAASLSDAIQVAANKAAYFVALKLEDLPWEGSVTRVEGGKVTINAGLNVGLKAGLTLALFSKGEEQIDPDTNESLGFERELNGSIRIVNVAEKFATCEIVDGGQGAKRGDIVQLSKNVR